MVRFVLLSVLILLAFYLIMLPHQQFGLRASLGIVLLIVGLLGYVASIATWLRGRG